MMEREVVERVLYHVVERMTYLSYWETEIRGLRRKIFLSRKFRCLYPETALSKAANLPVTTMERNYYRREEGIGSELS